MLFLLYGLAMKRSSPRRRTEEEAKVPGILGLLVVIIPIVILLRLLDFL